MCAVLPRKSLLLTIHASTKKTKVPVVHVRGLILLFFSHWPHIELHDSRRPLYDDLSVFDTFTRLSSDVFAAPKKLLGTRINFSCVRFSISWIDSAIPVSMFQYPNRLCSTGIESVLPESRLRSTGIDSVVPESTLQYRNCL